VGEAASSVRSAQSRAIGVPITTVQWAGTTVAALMVIATLLNGLPSYLKRVGAVQRDRYEAYWMAYCGPEGSHPRAFGFGRVCRQPEPGPNRWGRQASQLTPHAYVRLHSAYALEVQGPDLFFKVLKDLSMAATAILGILLWRSGDQKPAFALPIALFSAVIMIAVPFTVWRQGGWATVVGLRSYLFLAIALVGAYATGNQGTERIASAVALVLVVQLLFLPWELLSSIAIIGLGPWPFYLPLRLAAGFIVPSTLGVFAAVSLAFCIGSAVYRRHAASMWAVSALLVLLAGSATGVVALGVLGVIVARRGEYPNVAKLALTVAGGVLFLSLPLILNRPDVFSSVVGPGSRLARLAPMVWRPAPVMLLGQGLAAGSNTMAGLQSRNGADSALVLLIAQIGLVGAACFYGLLWWAWKRDTRLRPFYVAVALCSLTLNVTEAFPVNLMLGLALAHSASRAPSSAPTGQS
jgi:hypothetical protein